VVAVNYGLPSFLWGAYSATGVLLQPPTAAPHALVTVYVDSARSTLGVGWNYDSDTGEEPMVMPRVVAYTYTATALSEDPVYTLMPWDAEQYRDDGPCDGNVADARVDTVRAGRDGSLLFAAHSDGGDSPFRCDMTDSEEEVDFVVIDCYTDSEGMTGDQASAAITNLVKLDPGSGQSLTGQVQLTRLGKCIDNANGNSLFTVAVMSDAAGTIYELQNAGYFISGMGDGTVNG